MYMTIYLHDTVSVKPLFLLNTLTLTAFRHLDMEQP